MKSSNQLENLEMQLCLKADIDKIPLSAAFELLPLCNMNCRMCYIRISPEQLKIQGNIGTADEWLRIADELLKSGTLFVLLTGGEPFLHPEFVKIYQGLRNKGIIVTINTNGTLLTEELIEIFKKDLPRRINVTLYGASDETYGRLCGNPQGFTKTMEALKLLKKHGIPVKMNLSLTPENQSELYEILEISRKLDIPVEVNSYMFPCLRNQKQKYNENLRLSPESAARGTMEVHKWEKGEHFEAFRKETLFQLENVLPQINFGNGIPCRAGSSSCWINWKREITPCVFLPEPCMKLHPGNFSKAWEQLSKACMKFKMPEKCRTCRKIDVCQICAAASYWEERSKDGAPEYLCRYSDEIVQQLKSKL